MKKLAGLALVLSCGGGTTPQCENNNCTLPSQDVVKFTFDAYPQWMFPMDSCSDCIAASIRSTARVTTA